MARKNEIEEAFTHTGIPSGNVSDMKYCLRFKRSNRLAAVSPTSCGPPESPIIPRAAICLPEIIFLKDITNRVATVPTMEVTPNYSIYKLTTTLFKPRDAYRMRYQAGGGFGRGRGPAAPQYPQPGAMIDYSLGQSPPGSITLTVLDSVGKVVRTFTSESARRPGDSTVASGMPGAGVAAAAAGAEEEGEGGFQRARPAPRAGRVGARP